MIPAPDISVVINNYNYGSFLPRAIDTALAQRDVRAEIVVVDDGSTDDSHAVIAGYGDRIRPVLKPNGGQASAINAGVAASTAPLVAFLDADDWWAPDKLSAVVSAFRQAPRAGLVYHRLQPSLSDGTPAFRAIPRSLCSGDLSRRLARSGGRWPYPMTSSLSVRRSAWDDAGAIPDRFRISADAWLTGVVPFVTEVVALPEALGFYRIHNNTWFRQQDDRQMLARRMAHWAATADVTNAFLAERGQSGRLRVTDHLDYQAAALRLGHEGHPGLPRLLWLALTTPGEPNPLRRLRETQRLVSGLRHPVPDSPQTRDAT